jgi:hypothetical protein
MWWFSKKRRERRVFFRNLDHTCKLEDWQALQSMQDCCDDPDDVLLISALSAHMSWKADDHQAASRKFAALYSEAKTIDRAVPRYIKRFALYHISLSRGDFASARNHEHSARSTKIPARVKILLPIAPIYNVPHTPPSISASI